MRECLHGRRTNGKESVWSNNFRAFKVSGNFPRLRPRKTWKEVIRSDLKQRKVNKDIAKDRNACRSFIETIQAWKTRLNEYNDGYDDNDNVND